jgi:hypothetical protein
MSEQESQQQPTPLDGEDAHWADRRQRLIKCKIHNLHFDPKLTSGCAKCRKEGLIARPPSAKPQFIPLLLLVMAILLIFHSVFLPGILSLGGTEEELAEEFVEPTSLDPENYRAVLQAVENALFENPANNLVLMNEELRGSLLDLAVELEKSPYLIARQATLAVKEMIAALPKAEISLVAFRRTRSAWPNLRRKYFFEAPWFNNSPSIATDDRVALVTYRDVANDLMSLVDEGSSRIQELSQVEATESAAVADERTRKRVEWLTYRNDWRERLKILHAELPLRPPPGGNSEVLVATRRLEEAFSQALALARSELSAGAPARFATTYSLVEKAQDSFNELL